MNNLAILFLIVISTGYGSLLQNEESTPEIMEQFVDAVSAGDNGPVFESIPFTLRDLCWLHVGREFMEKGETEKAFLALCNISSTAVSSVRMVLGDDAGELDLMPSPPPENVPVLILTDVDAFVGIPDLGTASIATSYEVPFDFDWYLIEEQLEEVRSAYPLEFTDDMNADVVVLVTWGTPDECIHKAIGACYGAGFHHPRLNTTTPSFIVED